jgi:hypothetical protein
VLPGPTSLIVVATILIPVSRDYRRDGCRHRVVLDRRGRMWRRAGIPAPYFVPYEGTAIVLEAALEAKNKGLRVRLMYVIEGTERGEGERGVWGNDEEDSVSRVGLWSNGCTRWSGM